MINSLPTNTVCCKQFGARSGSKLFDTLMVLMKDFFEKVEFEKNQQTTKKFPKLPMQGVNGGAIYIGPVKQK